MAAAQVRHTLLKTHKTPQIQARNNVLRCYATKAEKKKGIDRKIGPKIDSSVQALSAKGFLRSQKDYTPPQDVTSRLGSVVKQILGSSDPNSKLTDPEKRFSLLNRCSEEFQHTIPNSLLHSIETVDDVYKFYETPVDTATPLDKLTQMELPPNLHIQHEYHRFHPDTDTKFGGVTAFPRSSTLVTGLKYKEKYRGHNQSTQWPYTS